MVYVSHQVDKTLPPNMLSETLRQTSTCNGIRLAYICSVTNTGVPVTNMLFIATLRGALS